MNTITKTIKFNATFDRVFKKTFSEVEILATLLKVILNIEVNKEDIVIENNETTNYIDLKTSNYDIKLSINNLYDIELEMQRIRRNYNYKDRVIYYLSNMISKSLKKGSSYEYKECISISFVNYEINKKECIDIISFKDTNNEEISRHKIILIDLTKINNCDNLELKKWLTLMKSNKPLSLKGDNYIMDKAIDRIVNINSDRKEQAILESRLKAERDYYAGIEGAERKGEHNKQIEIARKMKAMNLTKEIISQATGLTFAEIDKI